PLGLLIFLFPWSLTYQVGGTLLLLGAASAASRPNREGVWLGLWLFYRGLDRWLVRVIRDGRPRVAAVRRLGAHLSVPNHDRPPLPALLGLNRWSELPRLIEAGEGIFHRRPGGWSVLLQVGGPGEAPLTEGYARWGNQTTEWLTGLGCAAQLYTEATHCDWSLAQQSFDRGLRRPRTVLADLERELSAELAESSLMVRQYVILTPRLAGPDGMPTTNRWRSLTKVVEGSRAEAARLRDLALRQAETLGLMALALPAAEIAERLQSTPLACSEATLHGGQAVIGSRHLRYGVLTELPRQIHPGAVMVAVIRARLRGSLSFHLFPLQTGAARRELRRQSSLYEAMWHRSPTSDAEMLYRHTRGLEEMLLAKQTSAVRISLSISVEGGSPELADQALERLRTALADEDMLLEQITAPTAFIVAATAPGGLPLNRGLSLTTAEVAAAMLPALATTWGDPERPLLGMDTATTATCWYSVFDRDNYSALILGSSGAGKSVAAKTLLMRHYLQGADVLVIDPESEYASVLAALGGDYIELGEQSLNAFAIDPSIAAGEAAGWVTRLLSVMAGEERDYHNNRPVRSLSTQDMAWLFGEVLDFIQRWRGGEGSGEAVLSDFCAHLEGPAMERAQSQRVEGRIKRCADIAERLRAYTQGERGVIFNRQSTVQLSGAAVGIGLYRLANQLRADLTPALAFVLAALLGELRKMDRRRIILVDEAHRVLADPDAGEVLADVVRTSRKRGAGVWMASQSIRDFLSGGDSERPTPGEVLATVAATKLILGVEHGLEQGVQQTFNLSPRELEAITTQRRPGRGVLIAESERRVIDLLPGNHLLPVVSTSAVVNS
ncbi:MAG: VirB4 family type IV secretion system protein, partial [Candidatus Dormibacteraceae bacterium]